MYLCGFEKYIFFCYPYKMSMGKYTVILSLLMR